jgi:hypothetical protein
MPTFGFDIHGLDAITKLMTTKEFEDEINIKLNAIAITFYANKNLKITSDEFNEEKRKMGLVLVNLMKTSKHIEKIREIHGIRREDLQRRFDVPEASNIIDFTRELLIDASRVVKYRINAGITSPLQNNITIVKNIYADTCAISDYFTEVNDKMDHKSRQTILDTKNGFNDLIKLKKQGKVEFFVSQIIIDEIKGITNPEEVQKRLDFIDNVLEAEILPVNDKINEFADKYKNTHKLKPDMQHVLNEDGSFKKNPDGTDMMYDKNKNDRLHVAIATHHKCDILTSNDEADLVNNKSREQINEINENNGYNKIEIGSPGDVAENLTLQNSPIKPSGPAGPTLTF